MGWTFGLLFGFEAQETAEKGRGAVGRKAGIRRCGEGRGRVLDSHPSGTVLGRADKAGLIDRELAFARLGARTTLFASPRASVLRPLSLDLGIELAESD